ncbi:uncharacterized protein F5147DRAFT_781355 [Suillus discolor]|uniref:Uncharacterized protein n=1 Tax=Suillus discolor TaxID=1912936 RepID=A0A9P7JLT3_9AGAM|nr:uncharacterized protein F5147DRAFT_781355 [Suillus discolor]KAG2087380.1 hypothetical protein F5147DRAFT_781355 [Suillus discolor]
MSNRRTPADVHQTQPAIPTSGSSEQLQDNQPRAQGHSLSSSSASFHQSTSVPPTTADQQWFPASQQMIVTSSSFYDPTQASGFTAQQPSMNVWNTQFTGPGAEYFHRQHPTYQQPYDTFEGAETSQYSFAQNQVREQQQPEQHSQQRRLIPPRHSAHGGSRTSGYYRQRSAEGQQHAGQYSQLPSVSPNPPSTHPSPPQPSQQPTGQALAAQRTTELITGQFLPAQAEQQYPAQQPQPHFSPPPTQSQFQIQQTQFPPTPQFSQSQPQARQQSQFSQSHHPRVPSQSHPHATTQSHTHVPSQSRAHPHVQSHTQPQPQIHAPPNPPRQSQHYSGPSDSYYLQSDMYYAINTQGNQSPMLGLPRSHDSVSPASYASHPTSSSFDDSSSGHLASSVSSGNVHMTSQGMGHAATSSISTVTPGSPPMVAAPQQQQQQQQRAQIRQRPIMPITATATAPQAGPARPPIVPKPPAPRPATNRRARAPKRPRPSTSQGGEGRGGDSDDDSDDDDVVEWAGPSVPPQGAATGVGQRK